MNAGMGWGGTITFMSSLAQSAWHTQTQEHWDGVGWNGVGGWDNKVHVFFSSICLAHAKHRNIGMGWGGIITFMSSLAQSAWHTQTKEHWDVSGLSA